MVVEEFHLVSELSYRTCTREECFPYNTQTKKFTDKYKINQEKKGGNRTSDGRVKYGPEDYNRCLTLHVP